MGRAYKCDRCGEYWDQRLFLFNRYVGFGSFIIPSTPQIQLCRRCSTELKEFLKEREVR